MSDPTKPPSQTSLPPDPLAGLPDEKRQRIIDATITEFLEHGYRGASTNAMTERAGISKGLLFHYFGSKRGLYLYLLNETASHFFDWWHGAAAAAPKDIFDRLKAWSLVKLEMFLSNRSYYRFYMDAVLHPPAELADDINTFFQRTSDRAYALFLSGLDTSGFRPGIDPAKAIEVIIFTIEGVAKKVSERYRDNPDLDSPLNQHTELRQEIDQYLDIIKAGILPDTPPH